ncbi:MAG: hypothetical protein JSR18_10935 [Proteobacteria bacterium]|nr:hypothetical protein [Pseudomonadota bacterium]
MSPVWVSFVAACTALVASICGPLVTLAITRRQFRSNVLSVNREKWIATLREMTAELISLAAAVDVVRRRSAGDWKGGRDALAADVAHLAKFERLVLVRWNIRLLLNAEEPAHAELIETIDAMVAALQQDPDRAQPLLDYSNAVAATARVVIRAAWQRVKAGT